MQKPDRKKFEALVIPHLETLFRMAYRLTRNTQDAQDLVQDTCVAACGSLDAIGVASAPVAWLLRVQHNRFIDFYRRRGRSPVMTATGSEDITAFANDLPDPEQLLQQFENEQLLEQAFLKLDEVQRTLLSLRAEGYELPEIEAITGIGTDVLSARLYRARVRLAHCIAEMNREAANVRHIGSRR
jgi:RNA polymerase sigma-70 factor (ECF subfamily)